MPGTVVAVAVYVPLAWVDRRLIAAARELLGVDIGLLFTGTALGLVVAYVVRFHALAYLSLESRMTPDRRRRSTTPRAALGADRARVLADVHVPLLVARRGDRRRCSSSSR